MYPNDASEKTIPPNTFVSKPRRSIQFSDEQKSNEEQQASLKKAEKPPKPPKPPKSPKAPKPPKPPKSKKPSTLFSFFHSPKTDTPPDLKVPKTPKFKKSDFSPEKSSPESTRLDDSAFVLGSPKPAQSSQVLIQEPVSPEALSSVSSPAQEIQEPEPLEPVLPTETTPQETAFDLSAPEIKDIKSSSISSSSKSEKPAQKPIFLITTVLFAILAIAGIGFGVYGFVLSNKKDERTTSVFLENPDGTQTKLIIKSSSSSEKETTVVAFAPVVEEEPKEIIKTEEYLYVGDWNTKFKLKDDLKFLTYKYKGYTDTGILSSDGTTNIQTSELCVSASLADRDSNSAPSFVQKMNGVCIGRNKGTAPEGSPVADYLRVPDGEFYVRSSDSFYGTPDESEWESKSVEAIFNWLSDASVRSPIVAPEEEPTEETEVEEGIEETEENEETKEQETPETEQ